MKVNKVKVTYCSNYNGANVEVNDKDVDMFKDKKVRAVVNTVVNFGSSTCSEDGEFYGDIDDVEEVAIKAVREAYGPDVEVVFEEDDTST